MKKFFTSESVTEGHPDKLCDLISDSVLDAYLEKDPTSRVACECVAGKNIVFITGEITSKGEVDIEKVARNAIKKVGYFGDTDIDYKTCEVIINVCTQSPDIAMGTNDTVGGAGDQGMMFGFACDETKDYMPLGISLAHKLSKRLTDVRKKGIIKDIGADGKTQVTVEYDDDKIVRIHTILISVEHRASKNLNTLKKEIYKEVILPVVPEKYLDKDTIILVNPTGRFVIGGPLGDSGLTGRKIIVDTYGGYGRHGGGAFSGKDPTKVDRTGAYMARFLAKNVVANKYAKRCEVQLAYAIGVPEPISIYVNCFGTNTIPEEEIIKKIQKKFKLTPHEMITYLDLRKPIFTKTTNYGHFGKKDLAWEKIIKL